MARRRNSIDGQVRGASDQDAAGKRVTELVAAIRPILHSEEPRVILATLGDLVATCVAGHLVLHNGALDRAATTETRNELLTGFISLVRALIPTNEAEIIARMRRDITT